MTKLVVLIGLLTTVRGQGILDAPFAPAFNSIPLKSEAYSEGACIAPNVATNLDANWMTTQRRFYMPLASQFAHRRYAETLLSRPPNSESELQGMCLTFDISKAGEAVGVVNITTQGYDEREFRQNCTASGPGQFTCFALGSSSGVDPLRSASTEEYIVSVDNRTHILIVRCVDGFFRDYKLLTTVPSVSFELYRTVLNITRNLGFDDRRLQILSYNNCPQNEELNTEHGTTRRGFPRTRSPLGFSQFAAPFAQNSRNFVLGQNPGIFGPVGQTVAFGSVNPNINNPIQFQTINQNPAAFGNINQNTGELVTLNQNRAEFQNPAEFGNPNQNPADFVNINQDPGQFPIN